MKLDFSSNYEGKTRKYFRFLSLLLFLFSRIAAFSQTDPAIDDALLQRDTAQAKKLLQQKLDRFIASRNSDSLSKYITYIGSIEKGQAGADAAVKKVETFLVTIKALRPSVPALVQAYIDAGEFYGSVAKNNMAYAANAQAFSRAIDHYAKATAKLGVIQSNLGTYAQRMGNVGLSEQHHRQALKYLTADPNSEQENLYITYNNMGSISWYASQLDSAVFFFDKALVALSKTKNSALNQYYRPAVLQNNMSAIYNLKGNATLGIKAMQDCISNLKKFLATKEPHPKKASAVTFQLEATDNLAGIYKELGDYKKAFELLNHSYTQKQKLLDKNDPAIFISEILLGQLYYAIKDFNKAIQFLNEGLMKISKADGDYLFWQADACNTLALLYDAKRDVKQASYYYAKADSLYEASLQGAYDNIYLEFIRNEALFHAENNNPSIAFAKAKKAYDYAAANNGAKTLLASAQLLNLAEVSFLSGKYTESLQYSNEALALVNDITKNSSSLLDSIKIELKKPKILLQKAKTQYAQLPKKDATSLSQLLKELDEAMISLERRKSILTDAEDISLLMADQAELIGFIKKLNLELYKTSNDKGYLEKLIQLHESSIYNRIRARLDKTGNKQFANLPAATVEKELQLKAAIAKSLEGTGSHDEKMQAYVRATNDWNSFTEELRKTSPEYFKMRYASIVKPLQQVLPSLPEETILIRYFFIDKELLAFVADKAQHNIISLGQPELKKSIERLATFSTDVEQTSLLLYDLYNQLWAPLAKHIHKKRIIVIPDGPLYALSFDLLTPQKISSFKELATKSNMARYAISYNYSLFNIEKRTRPATMGNSFVAFAPGFSDELKQKFKSSSADSINWDASYFSLLPQPFAVTLATKTHDEFGGSIFLSDASTKTAFLQNAGKHNIIHLGTHAEANNFYPEYSRLIFAKNPAAPEADNSLYLPEIYACNLSSELTVLTACESGQPGYDDGEGLISMAHAFNYAGSQSIITALWKIDEQASALVMEEFYSNLQKGLTKDEALRQAKLHYLQTNDGRMLAPVYWAGLVVMGDTSPVEVKQKTGNEKWLWVGGAVLLLIATLVVLKKKTLTRARVL